ncbi:MAG: hypothetical protein AB7S26_13070 [Sandaracinaceae bacterium]
MGSRLGWIAAVFAFVLTGCPKGSASTQGTVAPDEQAFVPIPIPEVTEREVKPAHTVYLNREGATLVSGRDDAGRNLSSIVSAELGQFDVPAWQGSAARWTQVVDCVRGYFERYDVEIVDRRPVEPGYVMVVLGGTAEGLLDQDQPTRGTVTGLAPFNGQAIENAVAVVFTRTLRESKPRVCEVTAMEIGHVFGLDVSRNCHDLMSFRTPCGARTFREEAAPCGIDEDRTCVDGGPTQSSHEVLLQVLGPRSTE